MQPPTGSTGSKGLTKQGSGGSRASGTAPWDNEAMFDWDALERSEALRNRYMSPIRLKALAMKLRHRAKGLQFTHTNAQQKQSFLQQQSTPDRTSSCLTFEGPNDWLGLKTIFIHPFCILLICVPMGVMSYVLHWSSACTFWLNFLALVPLAKILGDATEELAAAIGNDTVSGLLNATFGNAVELIVSLQSIRIGLLSVVKASLLGSVLSNILLVLGTSFLLGGLTRSRSRHGRFHSFNGPSQDWEKSVVLGLEKEQKFPLKSALISLAMLLFACMSFTLPTIFNSLPTNDADKVLKVSRIGAWIVMSAYVASLVFTLLTHSRTLNRDEANMGSEQTEEAEEDEEGEQASLTAKCSLGLMLATTLVTAVNSEFLVDAIQSVVHNAGIPQSFIGVILLPVAGNACEHASAVRFAMQDRPGLAIGISVGSATQVALLIVPLSVVAAQIMGQPLDLDFGVLNIAVVTLSALIVLTLLLDGRSNWLKGYILVALYVFIAVLYWYTPDAVPGSPLRG